MIFLATHLQKSKRAWRTYALSMDIAINAEKMGCDRLAAQAAKSAKSAIDFHDACVERILKETEREWLRGG